MCHAVEGIQRDMFVHQLVEQHGDLGRELLVSEPQYQPHGDAGYDLELYAGVALFHLHATKPASGCQERLPVTSEPVCDLISRYDVWPAEEEGTGAERLSGDPLAGWAHLLGLNQVHGGEKGLVEPRRALGLVTLVTPPHVAPDGIHQDVPVEQR